nr:MAG TPA: hypothetical protein [Bacteriophage sp.]
MYFKFLVMQKENRCRLSPLPYIYKAMISSRIILIIVIILIILYTPSRLNAKGANHLPIDFLSQISYSNSIGRS